MSFKSNFEEICAEKGTSPTAVCNAVGITASAYSQWTDRTIPRKTTIIKIAKNLNVSTERLTQEKEPSGKTGEFDELTMQFNNLLGKLSQEQKEALIPLLESMIHQQKK